VHIFIFLYLLVTAGHCWIVNDIQLMNSSELLIFKNEFKKIKMIKNYGNKSKKF